MAMKFVVVKKKNPVDKNDPGKFYAQATVSGEVTLATLARRISKASMATRGDVMGVLTSLVDEIIESLEEGNSVRMGDLGSMRVSLSSTGETDASNVSANNIRKSRIVFTPSVMIKDRIARMSFHQQTSTSKSEGEEGGAGGSDRPEIE